MLILKAVSLGPLHGYGVLLRIQQTSKGHLDPYVDEDLFDMFASLDPSVKIRVRQQRDPEFLLRGPLLSLQKSSMENSYLAQHRSTHNEY
jgi:hypothetical protein